ncbi:MAG: bestrophin family protein [Rubripirellula sp.]|jgi:putative membrane protein
MYTNAATPVATLWSVSRELWRHFIAVVLYVSVIEGLDIRYEWKDSAFPLPVIAIMGTVIGLLLGFRTNSCYGRWWEARILWGAIVNDSRTWTRQLMEFTKSAQLDQQTTITRMCHRQIAWCYSLSRSLRGQEATQDLGTLLTEDEISEVRDKHVPNLLLLRQGQELRDLKQQGQLETFELVELEKTLLRLTNAMGGCERIRNTTFPRSYTRIINLLIYLFVICLPFGLVELPWFGLVSTSISFAFAFLMVDRVSIFLQDPFSNRPSDTPTQSLSRTIEINVREMLGETDLPEKRQPVNGILM